MPLRLVFVVLTCLPLRLQASVQPYPQVTATQGRAQPASQTNAGYDALIQNGNAQLQAGKPDQALSLGQKAAKLRPERWQAWALSGGALMNLKRYEEAADALSKAIDRAPEAKQIGLRTLRKQCALAEAGVAVPTTALSSPPTAQATSTTQAEVVVWKTIENSTNIADFQAYLDQYPNSAFASLAHTHLDQLQAAKKVLQEQQAARSAADADYQAGITVNNINYITGNGITHNWHAAQMTISSGRIAVYNTENPRDPAQVLNTTCSDVRWNWDGNSTHDVHLRTSSGTTQYRLAGFGQHGQDVRQITDAFDRYCPGTRQAN